jgi:hypothetical protein
VLVWPWLAVDLVASFRMHALATTWGRPAAIRFLPPLALEGSFHTQPDESYPAMIARLNRFYESQWRHYHRVCGKIPAQTAAAIVKHTRWFYRVEVGGECWWHRQEEGNLQVIQRQPLNPRLFDLSPYSLGKALRVFRCATERQGSAEVRWQDSARSVISQRKGGLTGLPGGYSVIMFVWPIHEAHRHEEEARNERHLSPSRVRRTGVGRGLMPGARIACAWSGKANHLAKLVRTGRALEARPGSRAAVHEGGITAWFSGRAAPWSPAALWNVMVVGLDDVCGGVSADVTVSLV